MKKVFLLPAISLLWLGSCHQPSSEADQSNDSACVALKDSIDVLNNKLQSEGHRGASEKTSNCPVLPFKQSGKVYEVMDSASPGHILHYQLYLQVKMPPGSGIFNTGVSGVTSNNGIHTVIITPQASTHPSDNLEHIDYVDIIVPASIVNPQTDSIEIKVLNNSGGYEVKLYELKGSRPRK